MAQKSVARSIAQARYIAMGAARLAAEVTRELDKKTRTMREALGDDPSFVAEIHNIQRYSGALLEAAADRLTEADKRYELQKGETRRLRRLRDERARELYEAWVPIRKMVSRQYSPSVLFHLLGYEGKTPREPMPLLSVCRVIVERARDESIELPAPRLGMLSFSREGLAAKLEPLVLALEQAIEAVLMAGRDEDVLLMQRDQAWAEFRQVKSGVCLFLEGLYTAADLHGLVPGIRHPRGSAARRKARAVKKQEAAAPQNVEAVDEETTAVHQKMAGAFLETTAAHQVMGGLEAETTLPHQVEARAMHETTAAHQVDERFEDRTTASHQVGGAVEDRTTATHRVGGRDEDRTTTSHHLEDGVEDRTTAAHRVDGAVEDRTTAAHASVGGFEDPETPSHRPARALRLVKTAAHGSDGGVDEPEPADHLSDGGFGDLSSAEQGSGGAVGDLASPGAGSGDGVEELKPAAAGSAGRFWHAASLGRLARRLVQGVRG